MPKTVPLIYNLLTEALQTTEIGDTVFVDFALGCHFPLIFRHFEENSLHLPLQHNEVACVSWSQWWYFHSKEIALISLLHINMGEQWSFEEMQILKLRSGKLGTGCWCVSCRSSDVSWMHFTSAESKIHSGLCVTIIRDEWNRHTPVVGRLECAL